MDQLGNPISYEVLEHGVPVLSSDGEQIGTVEHVLADESQDVFDGIVISRAPGHAHRHCFADADEISAIHERGVTLALTAAAADELPQPSANPGVMRDDPADNSTPLGRKLQRAWDLLSGKG